MNHLLNGEYLDYLYEVLPEDAQKSLKCFVDKLVMDNDPDAVLLTPKEYADLKEAMQDVQDGKVITQEELDKELGI